MDYKLAFVAGCDFRRSEMNNYFDAENLFRPIEPGEVFLFISYSGKQLVWILGVNNGVIDSRRWRLLSGKWDPTEIQAYANDVGFNIANFKDFLDDFEKRI